MVARMLQNTARYRNKGRHWYRIRHADKWRTVQEGFLKIGNIGTN